MAGLIADYNIDMTEVKAPEFNAPADDIYEFELADVSIKEGSKKQPDASWIIFKYLLGDGPQTYSQLYGLPRDPANPTDKEIQTLGYYKQHLLSLGVAEENINTVSADELVGTRGTFELRTTKGRDGNSYQNIRNLKVAGGTEKAAAKAKPATVVDNPFAN